MEYTGRLNFLIKPASGNCNMRCRYCFYEDETGNRETASYGLMAPETLERVVRTGLEEASGECSFLFQGGEPTLAGLDFYRKLVALEKQYNRRHVRIHHAIQTNGYVIDAEWARFLADNKFLVGLSLDGIKDVHDLYRTDAQGKGTFARTLRASQLFNRYGVEYNILTVVTAQTARHITKIYGFFKNNRFRYQQYIPCLDPIGKPRGQEPYSLTPERYAQFLKTLFDLWYQDLMKGTYVSVRYFDNLVWMLRGEPPESCGMLGHCTIQHVVEADGSVYPCDFYALDPYRLGNLNTDTLEEIEKKRAEIRFLEESKISAAECGNCRWKALCRGGCRRDREQPDGSYGLNYYCPAYQEFFDYAFPRLQQAARVTERCR